MFNRAFDLNRDGKQDASEGALEYMTFRAVTGEDENEDETEYKDDDFDEEDY